MKAIRYCGQLKIELRLQDDNSYYAKLFDGGKVLVELDGLNLSPHKQRTIAADSSEAFYLMAAAAISFATYDNPDVADEIYALCDMDDRGEPIITLRKQPAHRR